MTTNFGQNQTDMQDELPMPTNLNKEIGQEKSGEICNEQEAQQGKALLKSQARSHASWDYGEMLTGVSGHFSATHKSPEGK